MLLVRSAKQDAGGKTVDALEAEIAILIALATEAEDSGELTKLKALYRLKAPALPTHSTARNGSMRHQSEPPSRCHHSAFKKHERVRAVPWRPGQDLNLRPAA